MVAAARCGIGITVKRRTSHASATAAAPGRGATAMTARPGSQFPPGGGVTVSYTHLTLPTICSV